MHYAVHHNTRYNLLDIESTALPPLSDPALPPCSAGDVLRVDPSVAAVLPTSSSLPGAEAVVSESWPASSAPPPCKHNWVVLREKVPNVQSRCHTKRRMGVCGCARPSFGMTPTFTIFFQISHWKYIVKEAYFRGGLTLRRGLTFQIIQYLHCIWSYDCIT